MEILLQRLREGTRIIVVGDFDADGATSTALSVYWECVRWDVTTSSYLRLIALKTATV